VPNEIFRLTAKEFDRMKLLNNNVAVEIIHRNANDKTNSGLIIVQDPAMLTAHDIKAAEEYDTSQHLDRWGVIVKVPVKLHFTPKGKNSNWKCDWETGIEVKFGDLVWADYYNLHHCPIIRVEDKEYWIIQYQCLIVAKRIKYEVTITTYPLKNETIYDIIPLNGFCLFEQINEGLTSKFLIMDEKINKSKGIVKYVGSCNRNYNSPKKYDYPDLQPGDEVVFRTNSECLLENSQHRFFEDINLRYEQRWNLHAIIKK
jgi:hypothetical protein